MPSAGYFTQYFTRYFNTVLADTHDVADSGLKKRRKPSQTEPAIDAGVIQRTPKNKLKLEKQKAPSSEVAAFRPPLDDEEALLILLQDEQLRFQEFISAAVSI